MRLNEEQLPFRQRLSLGCGIMGRATVSANSGTKLVVGLDFDLDVDLDVAEAVDPSA